MTAEIINRIVQAVQQRDYILSYHYWEKFVKEPTRPWPYTIIASIGDNEPEIIEEYTGNSRGLACLILGVNGEGQQIHTIVGYERQPIKIITAYYPSGDKWVDGRIRRLQ